MSEEEEFLPKEVFKFTIPQEFTQNWVKACEPGWSLKLKTFQLEVEGTVTRWQIEVFPNGASDKYKDQMSVFLCLKSASSNNFFAKLFSRIFNIRFKKSLRFTAKFVIGIVARYGTVVYDKRATYKGEDFDDAAGFFDFIPHDKLFKKQNHIPDNKLTLSCEISISKPSKPIPKHVLPPQPTTMIDFKKLFQSGSNSDVTITCNDGKSIKAHKEVLVKNCPDFFLSIQWHNNMGVVSDFNQKTIKEVLRFSYYGEVENLKKIAGDLLKAAKLYKMTELEKICSNFIASQ